MILQASIAFAGAVGLYAAVRMQRKALLAERGELSEPSVVQTPRARIIVNTPNSAFGIFYYLLMIVASPFLHVHAVWLGALIAATVAAAFSVYLAYSLLFITRMPCAMCWTGHIVNWFLLLALLFYR